MNIKIFTAPEQIVPALSYDKKIFLAGSIEMGKAEQWQQEVVDLFFRKFNQLKTADRDKKQLAIFNPRRIDWNENLEQVYENPVLNQQINWELTALEWSDIVYFYFDSNTISPISLLELGTYKEKAVVYCSENYLRKANVDVYCERFKIKQVNAHQEAVNLITNSLIKTNDHVGVIK